jgi:hypothetical protein
LQCPTRSCDSGDGLVKGFTSSRAGPAHRACNRIHPVLRTNRAEDGEARIEATEIA